MLKSPSDQKKIQLLNECNVLLYTPHNEHFGIVPLEAMCMSKPVIAVNNGGPTETVVNEQTGFLCEPNAEDFGRFVLKLFRDKKLCERMGEMGNKRVHQRFSFDAFTDKLCSIVDTFTVDKKK